MPRASSAVPSEATKPAPESGKDQGCEDPRCVGCRGLGAVLAAARLNQPVVRRFRRGQELSQGSDNLKNPVLFKNYRTGVGILEGCVHHFSDGHLEITMVNSDDPEEGWFVEMGAASPHRLSNVLSALSGTGGFSATFTLGDDRSRLTITLKGPPAHQPTASAVLGTAVVPAHTFGDGGYVLEGVRPMTATRAIGVLVSIHAEKQERDVIQKRAREMNKKLGMLFNDGASRTVVSSLAGLALVVGSTTSDDE